MNKIILALAVLTSALCSNINALEITVLSPNGGERIQRGSEHEISWTDDIAENVSIELLKNGNLERVVSSSTESDGSYLWTTPAGLATGDDYKLKISSTIMTSTNDLSDANFSFFSGAVEITNPCGGVIIDKGSNYNISWNDDLYENVRIELLKGGSFHSNIAYNTESDGQYEWFVSPDILQDNDYKIKIVSVANEETYDMTNNFLIRGANYITGEVSGIWKADCSPYILGGSVTVPEDKSLTIEPGVKVQFQSPGAFNVKGSLNAVGTKENKIEFSGVDEDDYWSGLRVDGDSEIDLVDCKLSKTDNFTWRNDNNGFAIYTSVSLPDNSVIIAGEKESKQYIKKLSSSGDDIWEKTLGEGKINSLICIDDKIIAVGQGEFSILEFDFNGNMIREVNYAGVLKKIKFIDNSFVVCGSTITTYNDNNYFPDNMLMAKLDLNYNIRWESVIPKSYPYSEVIDFISTTDNSLIFIGNHSVGMTEDYKYCTKINSVDGMQLWERIFDYNGVGRRFGAIEYYLDDQYILASSPDYGYSKLTIIDENGEVINTLNIENVKIEKVIKTYNEGYVVLGEEVAYNNKSVILNFDEELNIISRNYIPNSHKYWCYTIDKINDNGYIISLADTYPDKTILLKVNAEMKLIDNPSAIHAKNSTNLFIQNCEISGNETSGIYLENTDAVITNNIIRNNNDGAIKLVGSKPVITNNTIINNSSAKGGAISFDAQSSPDVMNNIIWGNSATEEGAQIYLNDDESEPNFFYNDIQGGSADFAGAGSGANFGAQYVSNIDSDPQFAAEDKAFFYPYALTENSPCINNGYPGMTSSNLETFNLPELDLAGNPRVIEDKIDMGAFEFFNDYQEVSGNITQDTYWFADKIKVMGDITIAAGKTLTIKHGVTVEFQGQYKIVVYGNIIADGIYDDRITFTAANENEGWNGIQFRPNSGGNSRFNSCIFRHANGEAGGNGGVFFADDTQKITISDCIIEDDEAEKNGGGIYAKDSELDIINTIFTGNKAGMSGGAIYADNSHISLLNNTIVNNSAADHGDGIMFVNSDGYIFNTIIWFNDGEQIYLDDEQSDPSFYNCNIEEGVAGFSGSGAGNQYDGTVENIISADPSFSGSKDGFEQYNLAEGSPCINGGSSFTIDTEIPEYDLAGRSRIYAHKIDIGAYEYGTNSIEDNIKDSYSWGLEQNYPNPFNPSTTISFSIPEGYESGINLLIYNVKGQVVLNIRQEKISAGVHKILFDLGSQPTGVYYYMLKGKDFQQVRKMVLCK